MANDAPEREATACSSMLMLAAVAGAAVAGPLEDAKEAYECWMRVLSCRKNHRYLSPVSIEPQSGLVSENLKKRPERMETFLPKSAGPLALTRLIPFEGSRQSQCRRLGHDAAVSARHSSRQSSDVQLPSGRRRAHPAAFASTGRRLRMRA